MLLARSEGMRGKVDWRDIVITTCSIVNKSLVDVLEQHKEPCGRSDSNNDAHGDCSRLAACQWIVAARE